MNPPKLSYRAEIDGLRAIAVVSVILYHAQILLFDRVWFEGGFIGVDIFFVISGYLITRIILSQLSAKGSFSFLDFYERRARRILPMLFVVIFVSIPYAWKMLLPSDFVEYAESILASLFFGSNFFFYFSTTEYGADSALLKPFLHTWSLSVEEQFYLVFPIIAIVTFKFLRQHFLAILIVLSLVSLLFSQLMEVRNSELNFFLPFSRFWELAVGSILAYRELNYKSSDDGIGTRILPMLGLCLVAFSIVFFDSKTPHPSFHTLIPIIGIALIIGFSSKDEFLGKILGSKPFVWIGLISYSAYLWHFPIFAFSRMGGDPNNLEKLEWIAFTFALSILSYFLIEKPIRDRAVIKSLSFLVGMLGSLLVVSMGAYFVISNDGYSARFSKPTGFENYELDNRKLADLRKTLRIERSNISETFLDVDKKVLIIGNSHSTDLYNAIAQNLTSNNEIDFVRASIQIACFNENISDYELTRKAFYRSQNYQNATSIVVSTMYSKNRICKKHMRYQSRSSDFDGLSDLVKRAKHDGKVIIIFGDAPRFALINKKMAADQIYDLYSDKNVHEYNFKMLLGKAGLLLFEQMNARASSHNEIIKEKIIKKFDVPYLDKFSLICNLGASFCDAFTENGHKTLVDSTHWSLEGSKLFGQRLMKTNFMNLLN